MIFQITINPAKRNSCPAIMPMVSHLTVLSETTKQRELCADAEKFHVNAEKTARHARITSKGAVHDIGPPMTYAQMKIPGL